MQIKKLSAAVLTAGMMLTSIPAVAMADSSTGWKGNYSDGWRYYTSGTEYVKNDWKQIDGEWYHFDASGYMQTGWIRSGSKWYYLGSDGAMLSDTWEFIDDKLYCFNSSGAMETDKWIAYDDIDLSDLSSYEDMESYDVAMNIRNKYTGKKMWRYVGSDGAAYTGWRKVDGQWYYFDTELDVGNSIGDFNTTLIIYDNEDRYGAMRYGWLTEDDGSFYFIDENGRYKNNGWFNYEGINSWLYFDTDGRAYSEWHKIDGNWYYFYPYNHVMLHNVRYLINDDYYYFDSNGHMVTGWYKDEDGYWHCARSNGALYRYEWYEENGKWYYFDYGCRMVSSRTNYVIDGKYYDFNYKGECTNPYSGRTSPTY